MVRIVAAALALLALAPGCYLSTEPIDCTPAGVCLVDHPCWCRDDGDSWACFPHESECEGDCEFRWSTAEVDPAAYCIVD